MATPYSVPIEKFFRRIESDRNFFNYLNLTDEQAMALAELRAIGYLGEACSRILLDAPHKADFANRDDELKTFGFNLSDREVFLVASVMYEYYMSRDVAKLKCLSRDYTSTDLRVFDPSAARRSFKELYDGVCDQNSLLIETYDCSGENGQMRLIDFAALDIDGGG